MLRNSPVDLWRALVGLSAEKSIVVPLRRSPLNSSLKIKSSILLGASFLFRLDGDVSLRRIPDDPSKGHLFLASDIFESFVKDGRKTDRRSNGGRALHFHAFSIPLGPLHFGKPPTHYTIFHHIGEAQK